MDLIIVFLFSLFGTRYYIKLAKHFGIGQLIKEDGPDLHGYKKGTPTMGGIIFIAVAVLTMILERFDWRIWTAMLLFSLLGLSDDLLSVFKRDAYGMKARTKLLFQIVISTFLVFFIDKSYIVFGNLQFDLGWAYKIFAVFLITGVSNAVNITDGLDGLASFVSLSAFIPMFSVVPDRSLLIVSASLLGFLLFNIKPAKVFMGDAGSLALGGYLAVVSIMNDLEIALLLFGFVFMLETLSVIVQVSSFKIRKKRVFLMAPIHHHFELKGWSEERVVFFLTTLNLLTSILAMGWLI
jgi:phospho-N-acetylmuramoyl-pentapeptide-transferase